MTGPDPKRWNSLIAMRKLLIILRCCKAAFKKTFLGGGRFAESWHVQGFSVLNSQDANQYLKASLWNTPLAKASDYQPEHGKEKAPERGKYMYCVQ